MQGISDGTVHADCPKPVTNQDSKRMQRVKNMPPLSLFRPSLPFVLQKIPRTPKFDPFRWVKNAPKVGKSSHRDQNQISSEDDHNTPACQISDHSFQAFSLDCRNLETQISLSFLATRGTKLGQNRISSEWCPYSGVLNIRTYRNKWTLDKVCRKTNSRTPVLHYIYCNK